MNKIRIIAYQDKDRRREHTFGVTIPPSFSHWLGIFVKIKESGNAIILESGCPLQAMGLKDIKSFSEVNERIKI